MSQQQSQGHNRTVQLDPQSGELLFRHLCYLASSAAGLVTEPHLYGPLRLVDAAERLIQIMGQLGWDDPFLQDVAQFITENKDTVMTDEDRFVQFLDQLVGKLAAELGRRHRPGEARDVSGR
ncbi:MAG TPA: hypothetical protein GX513_04460 [Firmicutes bacterium]|nr:hypothetical protein [Bacillota bacterium]